MFSACHGVPGCGKSALIDSLAAATGNARELVRLQLDDQVDAKSLLGAYICTAVPGEFVWQPGLLTQARSQRCPLWHELQPRYLSDKRCTDLSDY